MMKGSWREKESNTRMILTERQMFVYATQIQLRQKCSRQTEKTLEKCQSMQYYDYRKKLVNSFMEELK